MEATMSAVDVPASSGDSGIKIGQIIQLYPDFPPTIELDGEYFVKSGYAVTENYDPIFDAYSATEIFFTNKAIPLNQIQNLWGSSTCLIAKTGTSIYRSADNGDTWVNIGNSFSSLPSDFETDNKGVWIAVNSSGYYRSTDNGVTWTALIAWAQTYSDNPCVSTDELGTWIVNGKSASGFHGRRSTDNGATWSMLDTGTSMGFTVSGKCVATDKLGNWAIPYYVNMSSNLTSLRISKDNGLTWQTVSSGIGATNPSLSWCCIKWVGRHFLYFFADNTGSGLVSRFSKSANASVWGVTLLPLSTSAATINASDTVYCMDAAGDVAVVCTAIGNVAISYDGGGTWELASAPSAGKNLPVYAIASNRNPDVKSQRWLYRYGDALGSYAVGISGVGFGTSDVLSKSYYMRYK
jgi:hypothetical protein